MKMKDAKIQARVVEALEVLHEQAYHAYHDALHDSLVEVFGTAEVDADDAVSVGQDESLRELRDLVGKLEVRIRQLRAELADDGSEPPF